MTEREKKSLCDWELFLRKRNFLELLCFVASLFSAEPLVFYIRHLIGHQNVLWKMCGLCCGNCFCFILKRVRVCDEVNKQKTLMQQDVDSVSHSSLLPLCFVNFASGALLGSSRVLGKTEFIWGNYFLNFLFLFVNRVILLCLFSATVELAF